jgi:hypothetical protein
MVSPEKSKYGRRVLLLAGAIALVAIGLVLIVPAVRQPKSPSGDSVDAPAVVEKTASDSSGVIQSGPSTASGEGPPIGTQETETSRKDWLAEYSASDDLFGFVRSAIEPALAGDHRAQYLVGQVLADCPTLVITVGLPKKDTLSANIEATMAHLDDTGHARMLRHISRCEGFFGGNSPVSDLPAEQQKLRYWLDEALVGRDPFSLMDRASRLAISEAPRRQSELLDRKTAVMNDISEAVRTREPAVMFRVAGLLSNPIIARESASQSSAWYLAACAAGYDCSTDNPIVGFGCPSAGTCNGGFTIPDQLQQVLTPKQYAAAYATSQEILYKINTGDWDGLNQFLELRL